MITILFALGMTVAHADAQVAGVPLAIAEVCRTSTREDFAAEVALNREEGLAGIKRAYDQSAAPDQSGREQGIWNQADQILRRAAILNHLAQGPTVNTSGSRESKLRQLRELFSGNISGTPSYPNGIRAHYQGLIKSTDSNNATVEALKKFGPYSCGLIGEEECKRAFTQGVTWMDPRMWSDPVSGEVGYVSMPESFVRLVSDPEYLKGASLLAQRLLEKYRVAKLNTHFNSGDLFEDVISAFRDSQLKPGYSAEEMAWDYLTIYATRGSDVLYSPAVRENLAVFASLGVVGSVISYLDGASLQSGKVYSLPRTVRTSCDFVRPYHFWMAAALGRRLHRAGYSNLASFAAVHNEEKLYEMFSKPIFSTQLNRESHTVVEIEKSLAFNDAGVLWAVADGQTSREAIDVDSILQKMNRSSTRDAESTPSFGISLMSSILNQAVRVAKSRGEVYVQTDQIDVQSLLNWQALVGADAAVDDLKSRLSH